MIKLLRRYWLTLLLSLLILTGVVLMAVFFYARAHAFMREELKNKLQSIAAAAAIQIDGDQIDQITGPQDMDTPYFRYIVSILKETRLAGSNIRFAYILRKTDQPMMLEFVADADSLATPEELDINHNGIVDPDEEGSYPGDIYEITEIPELQIDAFENPTASKDIYVDQWGHLISGYAPIRKSDGTVNAVFAIDMLADDFLTSSQKVFSPLLLLTVVMTGILIAMIVSFVMIRRNKEYLEKISQERSGLLRLTFHQLGEPLTIMKWSLETLRDETENPALKKLVEEHVTCMDEGLGRLNSIIDTLQLAEKVDLDTLKYSPLSCSVKEIVDNALAEWETALKKRQQPVHVAVEKGMMIPADRTLLLLVLRQLLVNAIEYSEEKTPIEIRVLKRRKDVLIAVEDHGCGIPVADMPHLFEKYRRASNAHLKKPDGNGLGLYIAKGIIEKAGGRINVQSTEGKGTIVSFTLPVSPGK